MGTAIYEASSATVIGSGYWTAVGAGTFLACLEDNSDATYCEFDTPGGVGDSFLYVFFLSGAIPNLSFITQIGFHVRDRASVAIGDRARSWYYATDNQPYAQFDTTIIGNTAFADYAVPLPSDPLGQPWTQETLDGFYVAVSATGAPTTDYYIAEAFISVAYNEVPAPVITGPASPVTNTSRPTFTWTVNDPDGDAQNRYQLVIRNDNTDTIVYDTGIQFGNIQSHQITSPLPNGNYDVTLRLGDSVNPNMSPFTAIYNLTITAPLPGTPLLVVTPDPTLNRVKLDVTTVAVATTATTSYHAIERSDDGGLTWRRVQDAVNPRGALRNGGSTHLTVGDFHDFTGTVPFTLEAKVAQSAAGSIDILFSKASATDGWQFGVTAAGALELFRRAASVTQTITGGTVTLGLPQHLAATYDGTNMRLYIDGVLVAGPTASALSLPNIATILALGASPTGVSPYTGNIEELRIWNVQRSGANLLANMNTDLVGNESGLVDLWKFNEASVVDATGAYDLTAESSVAGGHTATLVNGPLWTYSAWKTETFYDYTAPLGIPVLYRAVAVHNIASTLASIVYTESAPSITAGTTLTEEEEWLKSIADPSLNMEIASLAGNLVSTVSEDLVVYEALGRTYPVIFGGTVHADYFARLQLITTNDAEAAQLEAIRATKSAVLLQTCFGDDGREQKFLRLGRTLSETRINHSGQEDGQARLWEIEAWEIEAPATQGQ